MSYLDELRREPPRGDVRCAIGREVLRLVGAEQDALRTLVRNPRYTLRYVQAALARHGVQVSLSRISRHRNQQCSCPTSGVPL